MRNKPTEYLKKEFVSYLVYTDVRAHTHTYTHIHTHVHNPYVVRDQNEYLPEQ